MQRDHPVLGNASAKSLDWRRDRGGVEGGRGGGATFGSYFRIDVPLLCPGFFGARREGIKPLSH